MFTKTTTWQRWAGSRSDVERAIQEAANAVRGWSKYDASVELSVTYRSDLTETRSGLAGFKEIHRGDFKQISRIWIAIAPDRDAYYAERDRLNEEWREEARARLLRGEDAGDLPEPERLVAGSVEIRLPWASRGLQLEVRGEDRHAVEGLYNRLAEILSSRRAWRRLDPDWALVAIVPMVAGCGILGLLVVDWLGFGAVKNKTNDAQIAGLAIGLLAGLGLGALPWWLYPQFELVEDGESTRAERYRTLVVSTLVAVVLGVIAAAAYDAIK
jgi:hypothetical protein